MNITLLPILIVLAIAAYLIAIYNKLVTLKVRIKEAWAQIDVQLKRRIDLIPNLMETAKGYMAHEKDVFEKISQARAALVGASSHKDAAAANDQLSGALKSLFALAEAYPDLKAQEGFMNLQKELSDTEDKVSYSRQFFNTIVRQFNEAIVTFPNNLLAGIMGFKAEEFFQATEEERKAVQVKF